MVCALSEKKIDSSEIYVFSKISNRKHYFSHDPDTNLFFHGEAHQVTSTERSQSHYATGNMHDNEKVMALALKSLRIHKKKKKGGVKAG